MDNKKLAAAVSAVSSYIQISKDEDSLKNTHDHRFSALANIIVQLYKAVGFTSKEAQLEAHTIIKQLMFN